MSIPLTEKQKNQIISVLSAGCDWHTAAGYTGCELADISRTVKHDRDFRLELRRAVAGIEFQHMRLISQSLKDPTNWRTSVWWLEQHAPERFARKVGTVTARQLKAYIAILADVIGGGEEPTVARSEIVARLRDFAESIDRLIRDEQFADFIEPDPFFEVPSNEIEAVEEATDPVTPDPEQS